MIVDKKLLVLPGDGIGPEVIEQVYRVIKTYEKCFRRNEILYNAQKYKNFRILPQKQKNDNLIS